MTHRWFVNGGTNGGWRIDVRVIISAQPHLAVQIGPLWFCIDRCKRHAQMPPGHFDALVGKLYTHYLRRNP